VIVIAFVAPSAVIWITFRGYSERSGRMRDHLLVEGLRLRAHPGRWLAAAVLGTGAAFIATVVMFDRVDLSRPALSGFLASWDVTGLLMIWAAILAIPRRTRSRFTGPLAFASVALASVLIVGSLVTAAIA
jgi:hypothetical protein